MSGELMPIKYFGLHNCRQKVKQIEGLLECQALGLVEKATLRGGMTKTRLGIPAPYGRQLLIIHRARAFGGPKGFFNSP